MGREDLATDPRFATNPQRVRNRKELIPVLQELFLQRKTDDWLTELRAAAGSQLDPDVVWQTVRRVNNAEYKRQQAAPTLKVTAKAFGMGRRYPIASKFSE